MPSPAFWKGRKVLLTGHTGFKGSWLSIWLHRLGARVTGISLPPDSQPNLFSLAAVDELLESRICDIREADPLRQIVHEAEPEIVIHMAAQALVRRSYGDPLDTFSTNIMGTANILQCLRGMESVRVALMITTDKVYADNGGAAAYSEDDPLGGHDPYSASKAASEIVIDSFRKSFLAGQGVALASARAGNVIGGGDWSEDRLMPDAVRAWLNGETLQVRMPGAVRPWQYVLEPLAGYLRLSEALWEVPDLAGAYNFGPSVEDTLTVREMVESARECFGSGEAAYGQGDAQLHEAGYLRLDVMKLKNAIGVEPRMPVTDALARTMAWYRMQHQGADARQLCLDDIAYYEASR